MRNTAAAMRATSRTAATPSPWYAAQDANTFAAAYRKRFDPHFALSERSFQRSAFQLDSFGGQSRSQSFSCDRAHDEWIRETSARLQPRVHFTVEQHGRVDECGERREPCDVCRRGEGDGRSAGVARVGAGAYRHDASVDGRGCESGTHFSPYVRSLGRKGRSHG